MSIEIVDLYKSLRNQQVPNLWKEYSYPSIKSLTSWFKDLLNRINFIIDWLKKGEPNCFWFPGFFFPQSFLTAILQNYSRKYSLAIDKLSFNSIILNEKIENITHQPKDGVYIYGLYFDGANWNYNDWCLEDCKGNEEFIQCPIIHLLPQIDFNIPLNDYKCPIYRTSERAGVLSTTGHSTNFVLSINLPTKEDPNKWILRGSALILSTPF